MDQLQGSDSIDPDLSEQQFTFYIKPLKIAARASRPPYFLAEAMVNHKKMVHPPSTC